MKLQKCFPMFSHVSLFSLTYVYFFFSVCCCVSWNHIFTMPLFTFIYPLTTFPAFLHCFIKGLQWPPISSHTVLCVWNFYHIEKPKNSNVVSESEPLSYFLSWPSSVFLVSFPRYAFPDHLLNYVVPKILSCNICYFCTLLEKNIFLHAFKFMGSSHSVFFISKYTSIVNICTCHRNVSRWTFWKINMWPYFYHIFFNFIK